MEYKEDGVQGCVPNFGAIFMSNISTKRECFRRKLLGLPFAQANFVKQVKAGMILFLFEFERRELYGVFRASSDGTMNIVPHAFSSSGKQFPAQVQFTPIWYCSPLSEHEFRDAIQENYFSMNKFNFGLSEDQVRRLLLLFTSRKLEKPQSEFSRVASKPIGEDRRVAGNDRFLLRNRAERIVEEDSLVPAINAKYPGNSSNNIGRLDEDWFLKSDVIEHELKMDNCHEYDVFPEHPVATSGKRRRDDGRRFSMQHRIKYDQNLNHDLGQVICINHLGNSLCKSELVAEDRQILLSDRVETKRIMDSNIGPIATPEYPGDCFAKVRRATDDSRFPIKDIVGDKRTPNDGCGLVTSAHLLESPVIRARRATGDRDFFLDYRVENYRNLDNCPEPVISADYHVNHLGRVTRRGGDGDFVVNNTMRTDHHVDGGIRPIIFDNYLKNPHSKVKIETDDAKFLMSERVETPADRVMNRLDYVRRTNDRDRFLASISMKHEHKLDNGLGYGYPLDKVRRLDDEGTLLKIDRVGNENNMESCFEPPMSTNLGQSRQNLSFHSSKPILETDYSLCQVQPKPHSAFPHSMEQKNLEFSYPASHDVMATRGVPYDPEAPGIHHRCPTSVGVDCTSHSVQDFPQHHNSLENLFPSKRSSSPYCLEKEYLSRHLDVASGFVNKVSLPTKPNHYNCSLVGSEYYGKMEAQPTGHEVCQDSLFSESTSASIPYSRNEIYERQNIGPFIELDKHVDALQGKYEHKVTQPEINQAFGSGDVPFSSYMGHLHSGSSHEKSNNHDIKYSQKNFKGMYADSKNGRTSVFARLSSASEVRGQGNDTRLQYDECEMDASVDQVMDMLHQSLNHKIMKVRKFPLLRQLNMECDMWKMTTMKMQNDVKQVTEEKFDQIAEETRVVSFKRRSETMKNNDGIETMYSVETVERGTEGSVQKPEGEGLEGKQRKRRKLVRPVFGQKVQLNESLSGDGTSNLHLSALESSSKDNTGSCDDSIKSRENENRSSPNAWFVQLASSTGCEGNNANINQSSDCRDKKSENYGSG